MRELVGAGIELGISEALLLEHHRDGIGGSRDLGLEQLRQGGGRDRMRGVVPLPQDGVALLGAENVEPANRLIGSRNRRLDETHQAVGHRLARSPDRTDRVDSRAAAAGARPGTAMRVTG